MADENVNMDSDNELMDELEVALSDEDQDQQKQKKQQPSIDFKLAGDVVLQDEDDSDQEQGDKNKQENDQNEVSAFAPDTRADQQNSQPQVNSQQNEDQLKSRQEEIKQSKHKFDKFVHEVRLRESHASEKIFPKLQVDKQCVLEDVAVYKDYSCHLVLQDIDYSSTVTSDKFIKMQLLERKDQKKWFLWLLSGKVGREKQAHHPKIFDYFNRIDAVAQFEKRFYSKTNNEWTQKEFFSAKPGQYTIMNTEKDKQELVLAQQNEKEIKEILQKVNQQLGESKLIQSDDLKELITKIWDLEEFTKILNEMNLHTDKLPLGILKKERIRKAHLILAEIQRNLTSQTSKEAQITVLTNEFYNNLPHDFGVKKPNSIDHLIRVKEKTRMLELLNDVFIAQQVLLKSSYDLKDRNPVDVLYQELMIKLEPLNRQSKLFQAIQSSAMNTHSDQHNSFSVSIRNIYSAEKPSEKLCYLPFEKSLHNKFLLWHGCRLTSVMANLREGLRVPSRESAATGLMFGKGIYFTDCFSKAANQAQPKTQTRGVVFLCEVALGDMHKVYQPTQYSRAPDYCHSVYGVGQQKPSYKGIIDVNSAEETDFAVDPNTISTPKPVFLHTGRIKQNPDLEDMPSGISTTDLRLNDFVVYDSAQVKIKYIVDVDFINKN